MTATSKSSNRSMLATALEYAARDWPVFPLRPRSKFPLIPKRDGGNGVDDATTDPEQVRARWTRTPKANIGLATGEPSGVVALDLDPRNGGQESLRALLAGHELPATLAARTGGGGWHYYFLDPKRNLKNGGVKGYPGLDLKTTGGYVVLPPSVHETGKAYTWVDGSDSGRATIARMPAWLVELLDPPKPAPRTNGGGGVTTRNGTGSTYAEAALCKECATVANTAPGGRNNQLNEAAFNLGQLVAGGLLQRERVEAELLAACEANGLLAEDEGKLHATLLSGLEAGMKGSRSLPARGPAQVAEGFNRFAPGVDSVTQSSEPNSNVSTSVLASWRPFPLKALPPACRQFVFEGARARGIDPAFLGVPMLGALAGAIGNTRCLRVKSSYMEPAILWPIIVAQSGTMKSPPMEDVLRPLRTRDRQLGEKTRLAFEQYERELLAYHAEAREYGKAVAKQAAVIAPKRPERPPRRAVIADDITAEALVERLADNPRGLLLGLDELAGWIGNFDAYKRARGADVNKYLSMHRGSDVKVDRKGGDRPTIHVARAALSIVGTVQPRTLARIIGQENRENGLLARLFVAMPPGAFTHWNEDDVSMDTVKAYAAVVDALLDLESELDGEPVGLALTHQARELWRAYHDRMMERSALADDDLSAALSKLRGGALRIALVMALTQAAENGRQADLRQVDAEAMRSGIGIAEWFSLEAERVYRTLEESAENRNSRLLLESIRAHGGRVTPYELARSGPRRFRCRTEAAEAALQELVASRSGHWEETLSGSAGGRPSRAFVITNGDIDVETSESCRESEVTESTPLLAKSPSGVPEEFDSAAATVAGEGAEHEDCPRCGERVSRWGFESVCTSCHGWELAPAISSPDHEQGNSPANG